MSSTESVRQDILEMKGYVSGEQPAAGKYIKLNTNENPFPPSNKVVDAIHDAASIGLNIYPDAVSNSFRLAASQSLSNPTFSIQPENILCGNGSDDILTILTRTFVSPGDFIRIPYPSYVLYKTLAAIQGATTEEIQFNDNWTLPDSFSANDQKLSLAFLPNPNSPSGTTIPNETLGKLASQLDCPLVIDEAYVDFAESNALELVQTHDNVIVTRTLSKSYGLAGLRFGFCVAHASIIEQMLKVKDSYNCDALSIAGATAAICDSRWLDDNRSKIKELRSELDSELQRMGFQTTPSQANFVWCRHPDHDSKTIYEKLKQNHILIRYMDYPDWGDGLRISVGTANQISALVTILESIIGG